MDIITQGLLGAAASQAVSRNRLVRTACIIGFIAGILPDMDIFIRSSTNPLLFMIYHRQFSHSLIFIPFGGLLVAGVALLCVKRLRVDWGGIILAAIVGFGTHGLLDTFTTFGTQLLWPFSDRRISWDILSIIDPLFSLLLAVGIYFSYKRIKANPVRFALLFCLCYLGLAAFQHQRALAVQKRLMKQSGYLVQKHRVLPGLGNVLQWRSIYIAQHKIILNPIVAPLFKPAYAKKAVITNVFFSAQLPLKIRMDSKALRAYKVFNWFCNGYVAQVSKHPLILADMRILYKLKPLTALWTMGFMPTKKGYKIVFKRIVRI